MSGNFVQPTEVVQRIVSVEKIPSPLSDDEKPALSADLDATGHNIRNVDVLDVKHVVCRELEQDIKNYVSAAESRTQNNFAQKSHQHELEDVPGLGQLIANVVEQAVSVRAPMVHMHRAQDVNGMKEVIEFLVSAMGFAKEGHSHEALEKKMEKLAKEVGGKVSIEEINMLIKKIAESTNITAQRISELAVEVKKNATDLQSIPAPVTQDKSQEFVVKVLSSEKFLVPSKCKGLKIKELTGINMEGESIFINSSKPEGATVDVDELLTLKSSTPCFVRILFDV